MLTPGLQREIDKSVLVGPVVRHVKIHRRPVGKRSGAGHGFIVKHEIVGDAHVDLPDGLAPESQPHLGRSRLVSDELGIVEADAEWIAFSDGKLAVLGHGKVGAVRGGDAVNELTAEIFGQMGDPLNTITPFWSGPKRILFGIYLAPEAMFNQGTGDLLPGGAIVGLCAAWTGEHGEPSAHCPHPASPQKNVQ